MSNVTCITAERRARKGTEPARSEFELAAYNKLTYQVALHEKRVPTADEVDRALRIGRLSAGNSGALNLRLTAMDIIRPAM